MPLSTPHPARLPLLQYKRQLLNVLGIIHRYDAIRRMTPKQRAAVVPRICVIGGKAAPGYEMAKRIIKLVSAVADKVGAGCDGNVGGWVGVRGGGHGEGAAVRASSAAASVLPAAHSSLLCPLPAGPQVNSDPEVGDLLKVVFVPDYNVSVAETIIPGTELRWVGGWALFGCLGGHRRLGLGLVGTDWPANLLHSRTAGRCPAAASLLPPRRASAPTSSNTIQCNTIQCNTIQYNTRPPPHQHNARPPAHPCRCTAAASTSPPRARRPAARGT